MKKDLKSMLEFISFLDIDEGDHLLEVSKDHDLIAPLLKSYNDSLDYTLDLCLLKNSMVHSEALTYYNRIFFMTALEEVKRTYDMIFIPMFFNELSKKEGIELLHKLVKSVKKNIYLIIDDELLDNTWILHDFKDFDLSFFNLPTTQQKLIKIYPSSEEKEIEPLLLVSSEQKFSVLYVVPHCNLTGGLKMLYEQMKALQKRGHQLTVIIRGDYERAVPQWVEGFIPDHQIVIKSYDSYKNYLQGIDLIVAGFYNQIEELKNDKVPVLYWEQGHEFLYGDVRDKEQEKRIRQSLIHQFNQDIYYATDSNYVHDIVKTRFQKESYVLPIFVDTDFYYPKQRDVQERLTVLLVGNPILGFKGFTKALQVLLNAWQQGLRFNVNWACQVKPQTSPLPFEINYFVNVSQKELAAIYRESDILLSCSLYEGCPMPPLEAMASGVAVITTDCGGINQYAIHQKNALIANTNTVSELTQYLKELLINHELRHQLISSGLQTAKKLNYEEGGVLLEETLASVISQFKEKKEGSKKIKILFLIGNLLGGGAEKVLVNLVKALDKDIFDITVQTITDEGIYIEEVKKYARYKTVYKKTARSVEEAKQLQAYHSYLNALSHEAFSKAVIDDVYDIEVAFLEGFMAQVIANSPNRNSKKFAWIHTNLKYNSGMINDLEEYRKYYETFDHIVCVSEEGKESFVKLFNIEDTVCVRYNPINEIEIKKKALIPTSNALGNEFKMVAVGRLVAPKGYDRLLVIQEKLKSIGYNTKLILVGEGDQRENLERYIEEHDLKDCVTLVGHTSNPYQIMSQCQLFICSSHVEGLSSVVIEAMILGLPIVATDCGGNKELLQNGKYGVLVDNDIQSLFNGIYNVLINTVTYFELKARSKQRGEDFSYMKQIEDIQNLLLS